jgi:ABC transporter substrate binding protein
VKRRELITLLGGAVAAWPLTARAQQAAMPVIGYLSSGSTDSDVFRVTGLRRGLNDAGFIEGRNIAIDYRWAEIYSTREFALAGGLMSYGTSLTDAYRPVGDYAGRILMGAKPTELPVQQQTTVQFVINIKAAKVLGLTFPMTLLGRADEVIE